METITFNNKTFSIHRVDVPGHGNNLAIAPIELNEQLMNKEGSNYVSKEAETIDSGIFFYMDKQEVEMPENELVKSILYHLS